VSESHKISSTYVKPASLEGGVSSDTPDATSTVPQKPPPSRPSLPTMPPASRRPSSPTMPPPPPSSKMVLNQAAKIAASKATEPAPPSKSTAPSKGTSIDLGEGDLEPLSATVNADFSIRRGIVLGGRFRVKELIGAGAQCYVYAAEHTTLKSPVAIKCLQPALVTPDLVERFAREAQALTSIRNAHVAAVLDVGRAPCGTPYIVMEYLLGRDLAALLETRPRLEARQAAEILLQTCEGLAAAHALDLVHQDIKPSNIFLSDEMGIIKAKVVDFGVARVSVGKGAPAGARFSRSRLDDIIGGTPFYMSPEQIFAGSIDERSDIFALGMVLYEMLRGTHAFDLEMSTRIFGDPVRIERTGIRPGMADVIEKCLAQDPDTRYGSVAELAVALLPFAPSRARGHAEAAAALLRNAGHAVSSTIPSSIPPPAPETLAPPSIPRAAASPPKVTRSSRWPVLAAITIACAVGTFVAVRTRSSPPSAGIADSRPSAGASTQSSSAPIDVAVRTSSVMGDPSATERGTASSASSGISKGSPGSVAKIGASAAATTASWPPPALSAAPAASSSAPAPPSSSSSSSAAAETGAPRSAGTSDDLGF
jgi:eukaryotic-like serine/threonine-protein kinase